MKRRVFGFLLTLAMILPLLPIEAFAASGSNGTTYYGIFIKGESISSTNTSGNGWSFDPKTYTLYLNNFGCSITDVCHEVSNPDKATDGIDWFRYAIYTTTNELTINVSGDIFIGGNGYDIDPYYRDYAKNLDIRLCGIYSYGSLRFTGNGKMRFLTQGEAIRSEAGDITFDGGMQINAKTYARTISASKTITAQNGADIYAYTGHGGELSKARGMYSVQAKDMKVLSGAKLTGEINSVGTQGVRGVGIEHEVYVDGGTLSGTCYTSNAKKSDELPVGLSTWSATITGGGRIVARAYNDSETVKHKQNAARIAWSMKFTGPGEFTYSTLGSAADSENALYPNAKHEDNLEVFEEKEATGGRVWAAEYEGVFLRENNGVKEASRFSDFRSTVTYPESTDELLSIDPDSEITILSGEHTFEPKADTVIPKFSVKDGTLTFSMKNGTWYYLNNNPIALGESATLNVEGDGMLHRLIVEGSGTVRFKSGTVNDGKIGDDVRAVVSGGSIWINDNGKVTDGAGLSATRMAYHISSIYKVQNFVSVNLNKAGRYAPYNTEGICPVSGYVFIWTSADRSFKSMQIEIEDGTYMFYPHGNVGNAPPFGDYDELYIDTGKRLYADQTLIVTDSKTSSASAYYYSESETYPAISWSVSRDGGETWTQLYTYGNYSGGVKVKELATGNQTFISLEKLALSGLEVESFADVNGWILRGEVREGVTWADDTEQWLAAKITDTREFPVYYHDPVIKQAEEEYNIDDPVTLTVETPCAVNGVTLTYDWYVSRDGGETYESLGCYEDTYTTTAGPDTNGLLYTCKVQAKWLHGLSPKLTTTSECETPAVEMKVTERRPRITQNPQDATVDEEQETAATFTVTAEKAESYQWQVSEDGENFTDISGATDSTYTVSDVNKTMNGRKYRCVVSNSYRSVTTESATLTVYYRAYITEQPEDYSYVMQGGIIPKFTVEMDCGNPWAKNSKSSHWEVSRDGGETFENVEDVFASNEYRYYPYAKSVTDGNRIDLFDSYYVKFEFVLQNGTKNMDGWKFRFAMVNEANERYDGFTAYSDVVTLTVHTLCDIVGEHSWKDATCTKPKTCEICGETEGDPKGHDWKDATCETPKTCEACGLTEGDAKGHNFGEYISDENATCTEDGTKTATCAICGKTDTVADAGSAKGHNWKDATCEAPKTCEACGLTEGDAKGHNFGEYISDENATCTEDGTKTATCASCGKTDTVTDVGSATGHAYSEQWTSDENGHWHACENCGDAKDFAEHTPDREEATEESPVLCVDCGYIIWPQLAHVHQLTKVEAKDPSCEEEGNTVYYICSGCEDWFEDENAEHLIENHESVKIAALEHDWEDATCTEPKTCVLCGKTEGGAKGHNWKSATCTEPKTCERCGAIEGEPNGHSFEKAWTSNESEHWHVCASCGETTDRAAHDFDENDTCKVCGYQKPAIPDGLNKIDGVWKYYKNNRVDTSYTGAARYNGGIFYVANGVLDWSYTGLVKFENTWIYMEAGRFDGSYAGAVRYNGGIFYVSNGVLNWSYTGLVKFENTWIYMEAGRFDGSYTGAVRYNGGIFYVTNGVLNWSYTGLTKFENTWIYMKSSRFDGGYTGAVRYNGGIFYVTNGVLNWSYTGLVKFENTWIYMQNSRFDGSFSGAVGYNGGVYYVTNGVVNWSYTGMALYNNTWYYMVNSKRSFYTGVVTHNNMKFTVKNGIAVSVRQ